MIVHNASLTEASRKAHEASLGAAASGTLKDYNIAWMNNQRAGNWLHQTYRNLPTWRAAGDAHLALQRYNTRQAERLEQEEKK